MVYRYFLGEHSSPGSVVNWRITLPGLPQQVQAAFERLATHPEVNEVEIGAHGQVVAMVS